VNVAFGQNFGPEMRNSGEKKVAATKSRQDRTIAQSTFPCARFTAFHKAFYRSVEATSVPPFSPRALDRGLAGTLVGLARQVHSPMTAARGAGEILNERARLDFVAEILATRAQAHRRDMSPEEAARERERVRLKAQDILEEWSKIAMEYAQQGVALQYQTETGGAQRLLYDFLDPQLKLLPARHWKFRANRSLRDVEPNVNLWLKTLDGIGNRRRGRESFSAKSLSMWLDL